jgi:PAS domain S-box-containing protein
MPHRARPGLSGPQSGEKKLAIPGLSSIDADLLSESEARFRALAQATGQICWIADADGHLTDSKAWCAFTTQSPEEASGDGWADAVHPEDHQAALEDWEMAVCTKQPYRREHRVRRADGQYRTMLAQAYPALRADGTVSEWVGVDTDITLFHELQADVKASQEEFRTTFELAAVGIAHVRPDGRVLRANPKLCQILGYSEQELAGRSFLELTYPPDLDTNLALFERLLASEISVYTLEKRYIRKDGHLVWANLTASLKRDQSGAPQYGIAFVEDISDRKAAEAALQQSEEEYRQLFENMAQGVVHFSGDGELLSANPAALRILGVTMEEAKQRTFLDSRWQVLHEDGSTWPTPDRPMLRALHSGQDVSAVMGIFNPSDQSYRWIQVAAIPEFALGDTRPSKVYATFEDITLRRRLEGELRDRVQELEAIFASIAEGLIVIGTDGTIVRHNPAYEELVGWPSGSALYQMSSQERYRALRIRNTAGQTIPIPELALPRLLQGEAVVEEQILARQDGQDVYVTLRGAPLTDMSGNVQGGVIVMHDQSLRRSLEQQTQEVLSALLRMAELLVQYPSESEEQGPLLVEKHLAKLACSLLACRAATIVTLDSESLAMEVIGTIGYTAAQEHRLNQIIASWNYTSADLAEVARLVAGETLLLNVKQPPYEQLSAFFGVDQALVAPMRLGERLIGFLIFNPSTLTQAFTPQQIALAGATAHMVGLVIERGRLLREREEAHAYALALQEANRQMDTFLGMVSHELRTPLASLKLSVQLLHRRVERIDFSTLEDENGRSGLIASLQEPVAAADRQTLRLEHLLADLLDASRMKEGQLALRLEQAELNSLVQAVVTEQQQLMPNRTIQLCTPVDLQLDVQIHKDLIKQAVMNYLTNALKYSMEDTPVMVGVEKLEDRARVWVRDQGPGIALHEQEGIWERFHRVPGIREQNEIGGGLGLGLYVTKMVVEHHRGEVGIISDLGTGSTFWLALPLARPEDPGLSAATEV